MVENIDYVRKNADVDKVAFVGHGHASTMLFMTMYDQGSALEERLSSCIALAPIAHSDNTNNAYYDFYKRYWRSLKRHVNNELWGRGYVDRMQESAGSGPTLELEQVFWKSYEANEQFDDDDKMKAYMGHFPHGGVGDQLLDHVGQIYRECKF